MLFSPQYLIKVFSQGNVAESFVQILTSFCVD